MAALALLSGCAVSKEAERRHAAQVQELEARISEAEVRLQWETGEKERFRKGMEQSRQEAAAASEGWAKDRVRLTDLGSRLKSCEERASGLTADLDLSRRSRSAAEEAQEAARSELDASQAKWSADADARRGEMEACRGTVADLEAQNALLSAAGRRLEQEKGEQFDEINRTYTGLLEERKRGEEECLGQLADARGQLSRLSGESDEAREPLRQWCGAMERLRRNLADAVGNVTRATVEGLADRIRVRLPGDTLFLRGSARLAGEGRAALDRMAAVAGKEDGLRIVLSNGAEAESFSGEQARLYGSAWEFSLARAAEVARELQARASLPGVSLLVPPSSGREQPAAGEGFRIDCIPSPVAQCKAPGQSGQAQ